MELLPVIVGHHRINEGPRVIKHDNNYMVWAKREGKYHCSYCGSLSLPELEKLMENPLASISWADWKYKWPSKLYVKCGLLQSKFYTIHLADYSGEQFKQHATFLESLTGVLFEHDPEPGKVMRWQITNSARFQDCVARGTSKT